MAIRIRFDDSQNFAGSWNGAPDFSQIVGKS
jgi:hypothetical protein